MNRNIQYLALTLFDKVVTDEGTQNINIEDVYRADYPIIIGGFNKMSNECFKTAREVVKRERRFSLNKTVYNDWVQSGTLDGYIKQFISYFNTFVSGETHTPASNCAQFGQCEIIASMTMSEFEDGIRDVLYSGLALDSDLVGVIKHVVINDNIKVDTSKIKNKEFAYAYAYESGNVPLNGEFILRVIGYIAMESTSFIKNNDSINAFEIKSTVIQSFLNQLCKKYDTQKVLVELSKVFNRNKRLFLALKAEPKLKPIVNRISKLSKSYHVPIVKSDYLTIIEKIVKKTLNPEQMLVTLNEMDTNYLVKLYNGLMHRLETSTRIYHIRNGKYFCKSESYSSDALKSFELTAKIIKSVVSIRVQQNLKNMDLSVCAGVIDIAVPTSQKNFIGKISYGSRINIPDTATVGIYWENTEKRVDLDLSATNQYEKIGWNTSHRNQSVSYSGDMTDAVNGATESLLFKNTNIPYTVRVNNFTGGKNEFKLWVSNTTIPLGKNKSCADSDIIASANLEVDNEQMLGLVSGGQFTFCKLSEVSGLSAVSGLSKIDLLEASIAESKSVLTFGDLDIYDDSDKEAKNIDTLSMKQIMDSVK